MKKLVYNGRPILCIYHVNLITCLPIRFKIFLETCTDDASKCQYRLYKYYGIPREGSPSPFMLLVATNPSLNYLITTAKSNYFEYRRFNAMCKDHPFWTKG